MLFKCRKRGSTNPPFISSYVLRTWFLLCVHVSILYTVCTLKEVKLIILKTTNVIELFEIKSAKVVLIIWNVLLRQNSTQFCFLFI